MYAFRDLKPPWECDMLVISIPVSMDMSYMINVWTSEYDSDLDFAIGNGFELRTRFCVGIKCST